MFHYSFVRQRSCEDLHEDEEVILDSELARQSQVWKGVYPFAVLVSFMNIF